MNGLSFKALLEWDLKFVHENHGNRDKEERYRVANQRSFYLQNNGIFLASKIIDEEVFVGYYTELEEDDVPIEMPEGTRYEYFTGKVNTNDGSITFFAYYWINNYSEVIAQKNKHF